MKLPSILKYQLCNFGVLLRKPWSQCGGGFITDVVATQVDNLSLWRNKMIFYGEVQWQKRELPCDKEGNEFIQIPSAAMKIPWVDFDSRCFVKMI